MVAPLRVVQGSLPEPPYPSEIRARGFPFEVDWERIDQSDTWTLCDPSIRPWLLMLWAKSWSSSPCGTWPNNEKLIAARIGMEYRSFAQHREMLMRGWFEASDGRLYHPVISELVLKMCKVRVKDAKRMADWRSKQNQQVSGEVTGESQVRHAELGVSHATTTPLPPTPPPPHPDRSEDSSNPPRQPSLSADLEVDLDPEAPEFPRCPHAKIISLYHEILPELPSCRVNTKHRPKKTLAFWKWVLTSKRADNVRRAQTPEQALEWIEAYFKRARRNAFVMGETKPGQGHDGWRADFDYLISERGRVQVIEKTREAS